MKYLGIDYGKKCTGLATREYAKYILKEEMSVRKSNLKSHI